MKEQILLGTLLGDASIGKLYGRRKSYSIKWEHSKFQKDYAVWKAEKSLDNYSIHERNRLDSRTNKIYSSITCYSIKDDYSYYRNLFYKDKKEVSQKILNMLEPLGIAVWFLDDGNIYYNSNICHLTLSIDGFDEESRERIIKFFKENYNLNFKKIGKAIRLTSKKEILLFESYFKKYYPSCMEYKTLDYQKNKYFKNLTNEKRKYINKENR